MSIKRIGVAPRMSQIVVHQQTIYLAGQIGEPSKDIAGQTEDVLKKVDTLLEQAGSDKNHILQATIWLADMKDFEKMNAVWDAWVPADHAPARACGEAALAWPELLVEVMIIAAVK